VQNGMQQDFSWDARVADYQSLYERLAGASDQGLGAGRK
jgi:glycogen synthase